MPEHRLAFGRGDSILSTLPANPYLATKRLEQVTCHLQMSRRRPPTHLMSGHHLVSSGPDPIAH
jgi:hypothetical protein